MERTADDFIEREIERILEVLNRSCQRFGVDNHLDCCSGEIQESEAENVERQIA